MDTLRELIGGALLVGCSAKQRKQFLVGAPADFLQYNVMAITTVRLGDGITL